VGEATITVAGTEEMILTTLSGMTLYYLTSDVATAPKCAGACLTPLAASALDYDAGPDGRLFWKNRGGVTATFREAV
jgi:predicted lipoprotein with Yx(FWY)xxD motif